MITRITYIAFLLLTLSGTKLFGQTAQIPDQNFKQFLITNYGSLMTPKGELITANAANITGTFYCGNANIVSLEGIQYFTGIDTLLCFQNKLTSLPDISNMTKLVEIDCYQNEITVLPSLVALINLQVFNAGSNKISSFPQFGNVAGLKEISLYRNALTSIPDLTQFLSLEKIYCFENKITKIGKLPASLKDINCGDNLLTKVPDISLATGITSLAIYSNRLVTVPDFSPYTSLTLLNLGTNKLTVVPNSISSLTALKLLTLDNNKLTTLPDLSHLTQLTSCNLIHNYFTFEDLLPSSANSDFAKWTFAAQDSFPVVSSYKSLEHQKFTVFLNVDDMIPGLTFSWYQNGMLKSTTASPVLDFASLEKSDNGKYYCKITSSDPLFANVSIISQSFSILVQPNFKFEEELTITPNGDGRNDEMFIDEKGSLKVYDASGYLVDQRSLPCYWNGSTNSGTPLGTGFYILNINEKNTYGVTIVR